MPGVLRRARMLLALGLLTACGEASRSGDSFDEFWEEFKTSVAADDMAAVQALTRFPFLFEGEPRDSSAFGDVYAALFEDAARSCLATAAPMAEDDRYVAFCGPIDGQVLYYFAHDERGWHFAEFGVDAELFATFAVTSVSGLGSWRIADGRVAPWVSSPGGPLINAGLSGTRTAVSRWPFRPARTCS